MPKGIKGFQKGHRGFIPKGTIKYSEEAKKKRSEHLKEFYRVHGNIIGFQKGNKINVGDKAYQWKGENANIGTKHRWVERWKGKPNFCEMCGTTTAKKYEWANIDHTYRRVLEDYIRMCTPCHRKYDIKFNNYPKNAKRKLYE